MPRINAAAGTGWTRNLHSASRANAPAPPAGGGVARGRVAVLALCSLARAAGLCEAPGAIRPDGSPQQLSSDGLKDRARGWGPAGSFKGGKRAGYRIEVQPSGRTAAGAAGLGRQ